MQKLKRPILILGAGLLMLFLAVYLWNYLHYGTITVVSDENNIITISSIKERGAKEKLFEKTGSGKLSVRVSPGKYAISVENKVSALSKTIVVEARKNQKYTLNPPRESGIEPVASLSASSLFLGNGGLNFIETSSGIFYQITEANQITPLSGQSGFQRVEWAESGIGVAQDNDGNLYRLAGGSISKISLPAPLAATGNKNYGLSPDGTLYVSNKNGVYIAKLGAGFSQIRAGASTFLPVLVASNERLAIISPPPSDAWPAEDKQAEKPFVEIIDKSGNTVAKKNINAMGGSWSPDGTKLLLTDFYGSSGIYNDGLELQKILPGSQILQVAWVDNESVLYVVDNAVWLYSVRDEQSQIVASLPLGNTIGSLAVSKDGKTVYLSGGEEGENKIYRFSLDNKEVPGLENIQKLAVFLPVTLDSCSLSYVNFAGKPLIIMQGRAQNEAICRTQTDIELFQDGLDKNDFSFRFDLASEGL